MSASFGSLFCIASLVWLLAAVAAANADDEKCELASLDKIDCHPEREANELECLRRGCCWRPPATATRTVRNETSSGGELDDAPSCFFRANFNCYNIAKLNEDDDENHALYQDDDKQLEDATRPPTGEDGERTKRRRRLESQRQVWLLERRADCPKSGFRDEAKRLKLELNVYGSSIINIKISEPDRWPRSFEPELPALELPEPVRRRPSPRTAVGVDKSDGQRRRRQDEGSSSGDQDDQDDSLMFGVTGIGASDDEPLRVELNARDGSLRVIHENSGEILFETRLQQLIHSRRFIQFATKLSSSLVYGLGQHTGADRLLKRHSKTYTMFNYGHPPQADGRTAYSSFPFYINIASLPSSQSPLSGQANSRWRQMATGALMLNANAMDVVLRSSRDPGGASSVTWRLVGGLVNLFLFAGPRPHNVINQYESLVGRPTLPPAWALGYHQSRLNYNQLLQIKEAWARTRSAGIPMESVWTDLDFLREHSASYTLRDPELGELVRCLQEQFRMHYIPIVEPAISLQLPAADYEALRLGESMNIFAYYPNGRGESLPALVGVWNERCALLDFTHAQIVPYLTRVLRDYRRKVNFDGLWLDMNEPEVFANARLIGADGHECPQDEELQYWPGNRRLSDRTLCMSAEFEKGKHFDLHNLYAFYQSKAHYEALRALNSTRRPFLVSRAQFVGQAKYAAAWLGDLGSSFEQMRYSLLATIESSWMGQPMTGGDICGFFGPTSDELCARWFSLGAFYSLARNHNDGTARDQDPGALAEFVQLAARVALLRRYSLLPFLYSRLYRNHLEGEPAVSSLEFAFFSQFDAPMEQFDNVDDQLVWGAALVVAPVLEAGAQSRSVRLPPGRWYDISIGLPGTDLSEGAYDALRSNWPTLTTTSTDGQQDERLRERLDRLRKPIDCPSGGKGCLLRDQFTPLGSLNLYLRGGQILPSFRRVAHTKSIDELWTDDPVFFLEIALDENASATGELLWDSGESAPDDKSYDEALFWAAKNRLTLSMVTSNYKKELRFSGFVVYGAKLEAAPEPQVFKNIRLQYGHDSERDILTCEFKSLSGDHDEQLVLVRYENLILRW